jgi:pilus assembly protein CpaB
MKTARIVVLAVALGAGGLAAYLASRPAPKAPDAPPPVAIETVDILVASNDVGIGQVLGAQDVKWQAWPTSAANTNFIRRTDKPDAIRQVAGSIARAPLVGGEPIPAGKLIKVNGSGLLAAILPAGLPAISTDISPENATRGLSLPMDRVEVALSRRGGINMVRFGVTTVTTPK